MRNGFCGVRNIVNDRGNDTPNQFVIKTNRATYFQSYRSVVARIDHKSGKVTLSTYWDYSNTTRKHLYIFLRENGKGRLLKKDVLQRIKDKEFKLADTSSLPIN